MSQEWITLNDPDVFCHGWSFDQKGFAASNAKRYKELTSEDIEKINSSEQPLIKVETRSLRDCFNWSGNSIDPDEYIHRMTNQSEHTGHLDTAMRCVVEFNNFDEKDIVDIMANAGKHIDRLYDIGVLDDDQYAKMNTAIENRTKDLLTQLYSCRAAIEERDICAKAFNEYNQRIYITMDEHHERMEKLYNNNPLKLDKILDMISSKRDSMWRDWLPENWRINNKK